MLQSRAAFCGPSPRAWGLHRSGVNTLSVWRSIPTCVGFTPDRAQRPSFVSVHPHVRGVYEKAAAVGRVKRGPSPRAWGLRRRKAAPVPHTAVHPHVRGVYHRIHFRKIEFRGPSPRAWGLQVDRDPWEPSERSIPTCVGFTDQKTGSKRNALVHPHVRGVYGFVYCPKCGTPLVHPHVRGVYIP